MFQSISYFDLISLSFSKARLRNKFENVDWWTKFSWRNLLSLQWPDVRTYKIWKHIIYRNFKWEILKWYLFLLIYGKFRRGKACFACAETSRKHITIRKLEYSTLKFCHCATMAKKSSFADFSQKRIREYCFFFHEYFLCTSAKWLPSFRMIFALVVEKQRSKKLIFAIFWHNMTKSGQHEIPSVLQK